MTNPINQLVDTYINAWNEAVPERRRALVAQAFTDDATYRDPMMSGAGADAIDTMIAAAQQQFPGHRFVLAGEPDAHHDQVRFVWHLEPAAGGDVVAIGHDFATIADDGRLRTVVGFLEQPAA
jgi:ketosteroid isomerase-like protein